MKSNVKKILALLMAVLMLALTGCRPAHEETPSEPESAGPLRIMIDVEFGANLFSSDKTSLIKQAMKNYKVKGRSGTKVTHSSFQKVIKELGGPEDIELEFAPNHGEERDVYLTSIRTEMMAGKGPDVFVCLSGWGQHSDIDPQNVSVEDSLFKFPQQAMERNMFLPLDDYIEKAQFMEWDRLTPVIMDAGRNEKGQLLLPMTYTIPVGYFKQEDIQFQLDTGLSWDDMLSGTPELLTTAVGSHPQMQSTALAPLVDYEKDKLAVTEEELLEYITSRIEAEKRRDAMDVPECAVQFLKPDIRFDDDYGKDNELAIIPTYSRSGGYTALATSFLGININTKRPDDAFFIADYLMSDEAQRSKLYAFMTCERSIPTLEGLMEGQSGGISDGWDGTCCMSENLYPKLAQLREGISRTDFQTVMEYELFDLYGKAVNGRSDKTVETLVHDAYMRMNMMLAES